MTLQRLRKADERTKAMTKEEYVTWSEYRQASFTWRKGKRFREWAGFGIVTDSKPSDDIVDILGFLTFEMVQTLTEVALKVKEQEDLARAQSGGENAGAIIFQAILGTIGVFAGMLFVYKTGVIRVTPKFTRIVTGCIIGVAVLALGNLLLFIFTGMSPLRDGGPIAIIFSLVCIVLGSLSFLTDFDTADKLVRMGAPAKMAWGVALGLAVTLVWLYTEILRLLSILSRD